MVLVLFSSFCLVFSHSTKSQWVDVIYLAILFKAASLAREQLYNKANLRNDDFVRGIHRSVGFDLYDHDLWPLTQKVPSNHTAVSIDHGVTPSHVSPGLDLKFPGFLLALSLTVFRSSLSIWSRHRHIPYTLQAKRLVSVCSGLQMIHIGKQLFKIYLGGSIHGDR